MWGLLGYARKAEHRFCRDNLSAFMDGQLAARDRERVRQHLDRCQACRQELAGLQRTVSLLRALPRVKAPRSFAIPRSAPAPSLPFWMRPWAYGALRVASAATAVLLIVALAGNALVSPAVVPSKEAVRMLAAKSASEPEMGVRGEAEVEASLAAVAPTEVAPMLAAPMGTPAQEQTAPPPPTGTPPAAGALALPPPTLAPEEALRPTGAAAGPLAEMPPTLTPEEAAMATAAPAGMGGGAEPSRPPTVEAEITDATQDTAPREPAEGDTPPPAVVESYGMPTPAPAQPAGEDANLSEPPEGEAQGTARTYGLSPWLGALWPLRERIGGYPWGWWAAGSGALLAVLLAGTLWVRARRSRWP